MRNGIEVTTHDVDMPGLPENLDGIRIVHLTDFHVGCGDSATVSCAAVEEANALSPDLLLLTGDYVNRRRQEIQPAERILSRLRARLGIFASLGNHDYRAG